MLPDGYHEAPLENTCVVLGTRPSSNCSMSAAPHSWCCMHPTFSLPPSLVALNSCQCLGLVVKPDVVCGGKGPSSKEVIMHWWFPGHQPTPIKSTMSCSLRPLAADQECPGAHQRGQLKFFFPAGWRQQAILVIGWEDCCDTFASCGL